MKYSELIALWPCHGFEDFPQDLTGEAAHGFLATWTALWHPALLASAGKIPVWRQAGAALQVESEQLILVPSVSQPLLPDAFIAEARQQGAHVVTGTSERDQVLDQALQPLRPIVGVDQDLADDFLALGFCYLQVHRLLQQMHYSTTLDATYFSKEVLGGARACMQGEVEQSREHLSRCFDALAQERDHYYAVEAYVIDLVLVAKNTVGDKLRQELAHESPCSLLISADVVAEMARSESESLAQLLLRLQSGSVSLVGGELLEQDLVLMAPEEILNGLLAGAKVYEEYVAQKPAVFGRRRYGLTPVLPQILDKLGFVGALHATLDDGQYPVGPQAKSRWEGVDGSSVDALCRVPLDASLPETFLNYARSLGDSMDRDHVATVCLAHWPGLSSVWFDDLRRVARYGPVLGKIVALEEYLGHAEHAVYGERVELDGYRSPYLCQQVAAGDPRPISKWVQHHQTVAVQFAADTFRSLHHMLETGDEKSESTKSSCPLAGGLEDLPQRGNTVNDSEGKTSQADAQAANNLAAEKLSALLPRDNSPTRPAYLFWNPYSFSRRVCIELNEGDPLPDRVEPVYCVAKENHRQQIVVDIPPVGYAWLPASDKNDFTARPSRPLAEDNILRNEYMEVRINTSNGGVQSIHDYRSRGNRLSQQLALRRTIQDVRRSQSGSKSMYSVMVADSLAVTCSSAALGELTCKGRLIEPDGRLLAEFQQTTQLWRGSRILKINIQLIPHASLSADPWQSYYACRFAWSDPAALIWHDHAYTRQLSMAKRLEAPHYVELDMVDRTTALLTGGVPYHQRSGDQMLDSLLIVQGESEREFQFGIAIDAPNPMHAALDLVAPVHLVHEMAGVPRPNATGWLLHVDNKSLLITHQETLVENEKVVGIRARVLESSGQTASGRLACFRDAQSAQKVDFLGKTIVSCQVESGAVQLEMAACEWAQIEVRW
ncbi:MAG: hypothetical protein CMJ81_09805 [Planctomycetaceae bacterium]|nr:hypothetical protein [Planctomycetaceae bacterium]